MNAITGFPLSNAKDRHSPCLGICHLDAIKGLCVGCGRTGKEIADWAGSSDGDKLAVYAHLPERLADLDAGVRILPWTAEEIALFVVETLQSRTGYWTVGTSELAGLFSCAEVDTARIRRDGDTIHADARGATLELSTHDKLRAFALLEQGRDGAIILGLPRVRAETLLKAKLGPKRDWLVPPAAGAAHESGCACCNHDDAALTSAPTVATALATVMSVDLKADQAARVMALAVKLPRYATAMAIFTAEPPSQ